MTIPPFLLNKNVLIAAAVAAAALGAWVYHTAAVRKAWDEGYGRGLRDERLVWQVRESEELRLKNAAILELQEKYRALEKKSADDVEVVVNAMNMATRDLKDERDQALHDLRTERRNRLRWAAKCPASQSSGGGSAPAPSPSASGAAGAATCELPREVEETLIRLASEADRVVVERNALAEIAKKDREVCK